MGGILDFYEHSFYCLEVAHLTSPKAIILVALFVGFGRLLSLDVWVCAFMSIVGDYEWVPTYGFSFLSWGLSSKLRFAFIDEQLTFELEE